MFNLPAIAIRLIRGLTGVPIMQHAAIVGWGKCLPPAVLTNKDLESFFETSDDWITQRTGIRERRVSHVPLGEMAYVAAERALAAAGIKGNDVELIVFGTTESWVLMTETPIRVLRVK